MLTVPRPPKLWRLLVALAALCAVVPVANAEERCSRDWVCVGVAEGEQVVEIYARNLKPYPIVLSLRMRGLEFRSAERRTVTTTIGGGSREILKRFPSGSSTRYRYVYDWTIGKLEAQHDDDYRYRLPYATNRSYRVLQGYGSQFSHTGLERYAVDFDMPVGTPVHAARAGRVAMIEESNDIGCWEDWCARHANYVVILHDDGTTGEYYHLDHQGVIVEPGERVERGQLIARSGNTGHSTMPHLHFAVYTPVSWGRTRSIEVRFDSAEGLIRRPRAGQRYSAR